MRKNCYHYWNSEAKLYRREREIYFQAGGGGHCTSPTDNTDDRLVWWRERERYTSKSHISLWEHSSRFRLIGRGVPSVQISLFGLPQGKSPGPHMKNQESNPRPHTPCPAALPVEVEQWVAIGSFLCLSTRWSPPLLLSTQPHRNLFFWAEGQFFGNLPQRWCSEQGKQSGQIYSLMK